METLNNRQTIANQQMYTDINSKVANYMNRVFLRMCIGLLITFAVSTFVSINEALLGTLSLLVIPIMVIQLVVVLVMSFGATKLSATALNICFVIYSLITGVTFGVIFSLYTTASVTMVFVMTAGVFGGLALFGFITKKNLSGIGSIAFVGLIVIIIASLINMFFIKSSSVDLAINIIGVVVFCGMTMYDVQKIKSLYITSLNNSNPALEDEDKFNSRLAILGALVLYLDFINLFLRLLSLFGKKE